MSLRSPLGRVLGMGSAKDGTAHWWAQRVSAVALIPLTLWFLFSLLMLPRSGLRHGAEPGCRCPSAAFWRCCCCAVLTYHSYLGTTVVVEDYVHSAGMKLLLLLLLRFLYVLACGAGIFAILRIAFEILRP